MKFLSVLLVAVSVFAVSCERHEFEGPDGTKQLHEKHGAHAADHDDHAESPEHGEKPAAH
ncbi:MAG: hypothetical protein WEB53_16280 [Akkermansiaceae bacterium]